MDAFSDDSDIDDAPKRARSGRNRKVTVKPDPDSTELTLPAMTSIPDSERATSAEVEDLLR